MPGKIIDCCVAQLARASDFESEGCVFESHHNNDRETHSKVIFNKASWLLQRKTFPVNLEEWESGLFQCS